MPQIEAKSAIETIGQSEVSEVKPFSRLDLVDTVSEIASLIEKMVELQGRKREELLNQKEMWVEKNIKAVYGKGGTGLLIATISLGLPMLNNDLATLVGAVTPSIQQAADGLLPSAGIRDYSLTGNETKRVEAELKGARADQDTQQVTTDIQKSRETAQGFEGAVRSAATFYGR